MKRWSFFIPLCFIFLLSTGICYGGAVLYRIQQMKAQRQQPQGMTQEQYQEQQQENQAQSQQASAPPTYQQTVDQRNQAIAQAILDAHHQSGSNASVPFGNNPEINQTQQQSSGAGAAPLPETSPQELAASTEVKDTVDLSQVWKKLDTKSTVWPLLIDDQAKILTVSEYIDRFHQQGVKINEPPLHYVQMIDQVVEQNPQMLQRPFGELVQMMAIVDYDFDNGMNKDDLARKVLGEAGYEANKQRFTQQQRPSGQ